jgi:hypothetical protein
VIIGSVLLATGSFPIHLAGTAQQVVNIVLFVECAVYLAAGYMLIVAKMRRKPSISWLGIWVAHLLVAGFLGISILMLYTLIPGLPPGRHPSSVETSVVRVLGALLFVLANLGLALVVVADLAAFRQSRRSRNRSPPANFRTS